LKNGFAGRFWMNVTLSADASLIERSRGVARQRGKSLNQLFRDYLSCKLNIKH
jgi:hypothetical protein